MHAFRGRGGMPGAGVVSCLLLIFALSAAIPAAAEPPEELAPFFGITETRLGMFAANLEDNLDEEARFLVNGEALFGQLGDRYTERFWDIFLRPRPHIGFSLSPEGGTNQLYAGVTWEIPLNGWAFIEASFGGALHDGPTDGDDPNSYGCALNFRESASLGFNLDENLRLLFTVDHMSNGGLCDQNQGITNAGVRLGYRW